MIMPVCECCGDEKTDGKTDAGGLFWCSECIDGEGMSLCADCGDMFDSGDIVNGSAHGNVCRACHNYLTGAR